MLELGCHVMQVGGGDLEREPGGRDNFQEGNLHGFSPESNTSYIS